MSTTTATTTAATISSETMQGLQADDGGTYRYLVFVTKANSEGRIDVSCGPTREVKSMICRHFESQPGQTLPTSTYNIKCAKDLNAANQICAARLATLGSEERVIVARFAVLGRKRSSGSDFTTTSDRTVTSANSGREYQYVVHKHAVNATGRVPTVTSVRTNADTECSTMASGNTVEWARTKEEADRIASESLRDENTISVVSRIEGTAQKRAKVTQEMFIIE